MTPTGDRPGGSRASRAPQLSAARLPEPRRLLSWVYVGRLCLASAIFLAVLFAWRNAEPAVTLSASLILFLSGAFTAGSFWYSHLARSRLGENFLYSQVLFDVGMVTWVIHLTGGPESAFAPLYILVICAAAVLLPMLGGILVGLLASILYCADIALSAPHALTDPGVLLQTALFVTVAMVTGYLGDRLRQTGTVLGEIETELRLLRLDTDEILGSMNSGILTVDGGGRLVYMNPAASEILTLTPEEWEGRPVLERLDAAAPGLGAIIRRSAETRQAIRRSETSGSEGGTILGVSTTLMERPDPDGPPVTAIFQDITERMRMEALRRRAERLEAVAELSASLAHEIKNPLASIRSAVEQLTGEGVDAEDKEILERLVVRESDRLSRLLAEFIDFARVRVRDAASVRLAQVVSHAVDLVRAHPDASGRVIRVSLPEGGGPVVRGDEDLLHRAVANLVLNGAQWAGEGGEVEVALDTVQSDVLAPEMGISELVRLRVTDTGPGIPAGDVDHVFSPFFTSRPGGTGLGLALVQRAVDVHGGAVFVAPARAGEGEGATFVVYLHALREPAAQVSPTH